MKDEHIFVDTNILVYAHDTEAGSKHRIARERVTQLWHRELVPSISVQVLQELYVNLTRRNPFRRAAGEIVKDYLVWDVIDNDRSLLTDGIEFRERWRLSFWDALILAAARRAKASLLWTEDLDEGHDYEGIVVVNPLRSKTDDV